MLILSTQSERELKVMNHYNQIGHSYANDKYVIIYEPFIMFFEYLEFFFVCSNGRLYEICFINQFKSFYLFNRIEPYLILQSTIELSHIHR